MNNKVDKCDISMIKSHTKPFNLCCKFEYLKKMKIVRSLICPSSLLVYIYMECRNTWLGFSEKVFYKGCPPVIASLILLTGCIDQIRIGQIFGQLRKYIYDEI